MREIKFRAFDTVSKTIIYDFCKLIDGRFHGFDCTNNYVGVGDEQIMQFTGLIDIHGKDIYEGDILKHYPGFGCEWKERQSVVEYSDCSFWENHTESGRGMKFVLNNRDQKLEVIGNRYETPELLK